MDFESSPYWPGVPAISSVESQQEKLKLILPLVRQVSGDLLPIVLNLLPD
jgi:hypothetical protein